MRSNAVVAWVNVDDRSEQSDDSLDRTLYTAANLVWSPYELVDMGIEWLWGERKDKNNDDGDDNRVMASTKFKF